MTLCNAWLDWSDSERYECERDLPHDGEVDMHFAMVEGEFTNWSDSWPLACRGGPSACPLCHKHEIDTKMFGGLRVMSCPSVPKGTMRVFPNVEGVTGVLVLEPKR